MKFLCLGYFDPDAMGGLPKAEIDALMMSCEPLVQELYKSGHLIFDAGLDLPTMSVRTRSGKLSATDGPFVETKEVIGGVFVIEAYDMDDAIRVAALHPAARMGEEYGWGLEIRPIRMFERR